MKRLIIITLLALSCSLQAGAQWYLFPGTKSTAGDSAKSTAPSAPEGKNVPEAPDAESGVAAASTVASASGTVASADSAAVTDSLAADEYVCRIPETIRLTMALPFDASTGKPSQHMFDFWSGALLAIREAGKSGLGIDADIFDSNAPGESFKGERADSSDIIICCDSRSVFEAASLCGPGKCVVSPLERIGSDSCRVVQLQTPWQCQCRQLARWVALESNYGDEILVVCRKSSNNDTLCCLFNALDSLGVGYRIIESVNETNSASFRTSGVQRFITVENDYGYLHNVAESIGILGQKGRRVTFYTMSHIRNIRGIEDSHVLYDANTRMVAQYNIDYGNPDVRDFILSFRALFECEPSRFAFHGYDSVRYLISMCAEYGVMWDRKLTEKPFRGYQTSFRFDESEDGGLTNVAAHSITFCNNLTLSVK